MAAIPEAKTRLRAPPSSATRHSSSAPLVGLSVREYSYPSIQRAASPSSLPRRPPTPSCLYVETW